MCSLAGICDADYPAGDASAGITRRLRFKIILPGVDDQTPTEDRIVTVELDQFRCHVDGGNPFAVCLNISKIADVMLLRIGAAMFYAGRIEMPARRFAVRSAAIAKFMNMKTVQTGRQPADFARYFYEVVRLCECYDTVNFASFGGMQNSDRGRDVTVRSGGGNRGSGNCNTNYNCIEDFDKCSHTCIYRETGSHRTFRD